MKRAVGVYAYICEGAMEEGPMDAANVDQGQEGILSVGKPNLGHLPLIFLHVPGAPSTDEMIGLTRKHAQNAANVTGRKFEFVRFGENGREHLDWIMP